MLRFVLFDLGGVLFDYDHRIATRALARRSPLTEEEIFDRLFTSGLETQCDLGAFSTRDFLAELRRRTEYDGSDADLRRSWAEIFRKKADSWLLVDRLVEAGIPLGVVSNTNEIHFEQLSAMADFGARFRWLFLSYRMRARKPEPDYYAAVVNHLPFEPTEGLFIDDKAENVLAAEAAGFRGHLFRDATALGEELARAGG